MSLGGGKRPNAKTPTKALGIDFQSSQYGQCIIVGFGQNKVAGNCIWYANFKAIAQQQQQSGGKGGGGGGSSGPTSYTYKTDYMLGLTEGPGTIVHVYNGTSTTSLSATGGISFSGTVGQAAWSNLSGNEALGYSGTVLVAYSARDLGSNASLPNDNYEVAWTSTQFGSGILDADPTVVATQICTNAQYGVNFSKLGDLTLWRNYCLAAGIFVSPVYDQQQPASQALADLFKYTNSDCYFSEGVLKVGCYGDATITGNGVTYTPNTSSVADLTPDDFLVASASDDLIQIHRTAPADALNIQRLEFADRSNTYHKSQVVAMIDDDVVTNGGRSDTTETTTMITSAAIARLVAQNMVQRSFYIRNKYEFVLSDRYCYLEPFDIVTLTNADQGFNLFPVRITEVEEDEHDNIKVTAEEFPEGTGHAAQYSTQSNSGGTVDPNSDPGPVAGPYLFRGPGFLVGNGKPEIWCAVTGDGNPLWAGCDVYLSHNGTAYTFCCSYARQSRYGYITNSMLVQSDPDTVSTPNVLLNGYQTQLLGGSQADADQFITLAMIDKEVIAYETATLAAGPSYNLSYLRRGGYGTAIAAHSVNAPFVRLDDGILRIPVDPSQIGNTIYLKFLSFNCFGRTPRTLDQETAYSYVIGTSEELPDTPVTPDNFAVLPIADGVNITWTNDNPAAVGCTSIEFATASSGPWSVLAQEGPTTTSYTHHFVTGATYYYRARSRGHVVAAGWSPYTATFSSTGVNVSGTGGVISTVATNTTNITTTTALAQQVNVINPGFDAGDVGWLKDAGWSIKTDSAGPGAGVGYAEFNPTGSNGAIKNQALCYVTVGQTYKAQALIKAIGANGSAYVKIAWLDASLNVVGSNTPGSVVTGTTTQGSHVVAQAPSGAVYGQVWIEVDGCTTGKYQVDNVVSTLQPTDLTEVPDGTGRYAVTNGASLYGVAQVDSNNLAAIDFSQSVHVNKTLDYIPSGSIYQAGTVIADSEVVDNANFEASGTILPPPGWLKSRFPTLGYTTSGQAHAGSQSLVVFGGTSGAYEGIRHARQFKVRPGDVYVISAWMACDGSALCYGAGLFYNGTSFAGSQTAFSSSTTGWHFYSGAIQVPASCDTMQLLFYTNTHNTEFWLDDVQLLKMRQQNALSQTTWAGVRSVLSSSPITYSINTASPATVTFSVAAVTNYGGGQNVSYSASSASVSQARSTTVTYYLYYRDPTNSGGSKTLNVTTNVSDLAQYPDVVNLGNATVTVPASGSGSGGGGGGGGFCVCADMFVDEDTLAGEARPGHLFDCCDWPTTGERTFKRRLHSVEHVETECVRLTTESGAVLDCGITTPFDLLTEAGGVKRAPEMLGERVLTDRGIERVVRVEAIGARPVCFFHFGGISYAAGADPAHRIYSHNTGALKP